VNLYPLYVVFWLALGLFLFLWPVLDAGAPAQFTSWRGVSTGWIALLFALFNVVRWWSWRSYRARQQEAREAQAQLRQRSSHVRQTERPRDPTFDFGAEAERPAEEEGAE
jgi:hypothetical protein